MRKSKLLIVEDDEDTCKLFAEFFREEPYELESCANGREALIRYLQCFHCQPMAGILLDLGLGDINGRRVIRAIREIEHGSQQDCTPIRIGIISGSIKMLDGLCLLDDCNVTLRIEKPVAADILLSQVRDWLTRPIVSGVRRTAAWIGAQ